MREIAVAFLVLSGCRGSDATANKPPPADLPPTRAECTLLLEHYAGLVEREQPRTGDASSGAELRSYLMQEEGYTGCSALHRGQYQCARAATRADEFEACLK